MSDIIQIIGKKGSVEILYEIKKRNKITYSELHKSLRLSSRTLSRRLKTLAKNNLIKRIVNEDRTVEYTLTKKGLQLLEIIDQILDQD